MASLYKMSENIKKCDTMWKREELIEIVISASW